MAAFKPELITNPKLNAKARDAAAVPPAPVAQAPEPIPVPVQPVAPAVVQKPVFVPVPVAVQTPKQKPLEVTADVARKAQGIYPAEQRAKQSMIENAKSPPAPVGAWGKPK